MARADRGTSGRFEGLEPRLLLAADPILPDHPLWAIPRGEAVIDGVLDDAAWDSALEIFRTQATRDDRAVWVRMMYNDFGLFLSVEVEDNNIWADGNGDGIGNRWEVESDDSLTFYFDPNQSRDEYFQADDRAFGVNLGAPDAAINGSGVVRRWKYIYGTGDGGSMDVLPGGVLEAGMQYASTVNGTINDPSDVDVGWSIEMFVPWAAVGLGAAPVHGQTIGMNFDVIMDNDGFGRNLRDNRSEPNRFDVPHFIDDHVQGTHSSFSATMSGIWGPISYAEAMFIDPAAGEAPAAVTDLAVTGVSEYGARIAFTAPAGTASGAGHVSGYAIRYSTSPINSESDWLAAAELANNYVPRLRGLGEELRLVELTPGTTYFVAVRGVDAAGNLGALGADAVFTTEALGDLSYKGRIVPSPLGGTFIFENGEAFIPVGDHIDLSWHYTRALYPGEVWDNANGMYHNFYANPSYEGPAGPYFDYLQEHGVNTMRLYLELQYVGFEGNPDLPRGTYWLENNVGEYNMAMMGYLHNVLEMAAEHDIYVIISPFQSYFYDEQFNLEGPWGTNFGGPLSDINDFFQTPETLEIAKARMDYVVHWAKMSPYYSQIIGWEPMSEWESYEWTLNAEGNLDPGREREMRRRAIWVNELAEHIRSIDPESLVLNSTIARDPRGPIARLSFYSRNFDALTPHLYLNSNEEAVNNPADDRTALAAREMASFTSYWMTNRIDNRPILNGEWGTTRPKWPTGVPHYDADYTQQEDEAIYRVVLWSGLASGQVGTGLRINSEELMWNGMLLTDAMRDSQLAFANFVYSDSLGFDFAHFNAFNLAGRIRASSVSGHSLITMGSSDGVQGILYILRDGNVTSGIVSDGVITITGLRPDQIMDIEIWSTAAGSAGPMTTLEGVFVGDGTLTFTLPSFMTDVAVKFKARENPNQQVQEAVSIKRNGDLITFALGADGQPIARIEFADGSTADQDIASLARFHGRIHDMTPYVTPDGLVHLAATDKNHHVWIFTGNINTGVWTAIDKTAELGAPGLTGDLTTYQPSWGAIHIAGLDARGHSINYWWAWGLDSWQYSDLTAELNGPTLTRGLAGYVAPWDGLNLAGIDENNEVIVYWWSPASEGWHVQNMTQSVGGPKLYGQLDAYVTDWGGLNIAGVDDQGHINVYWWAPGLDTWYATDLTAQTGGPLIAKGVEVTTSSIDGGINIFGIDADDQLHMMRWTPASNVWVSTKLADSITAPGADFPLSSAAAGDRIILGAARKDGERELIIFSYFISTQEWTYTVTANNLAA